MKVSVVENGQFVDYERSGECLQCGQCCRSSITFEIGVHPEVDNDTGTNHDLSSWEDFAVFKAQRLWWWIKVTKISEGSDGCSDLEGDLCSSWDDFDDRSPGCRYWPFHPRYVLDGCGYSFTSPR